MKGKKRIFLAAATLASVGAVAALIAGVTFGLFSATSTSTPSTFTAGTVTLANAVTVQCTVGPMVPGDSSTGWTGTITGQTDAKTAPCTFDIDYVGTAPAYIGVSETSGGTGLDAAGGLQYQILDNNAASFTTGGGALKPGTLFVSSDAAGTDHHKFTVDYALPLSADNSFQGKTATLSLTVNAVQSGNNGSAGGCTAGSTCPGITSWS